MKDLESEILEYMKERNWHRVRASDIAKSISIEAAELLEIFQWTDMTMAQLKKDKKRLDQVRAELGDVFIYCIEMAVLLGIDAKTAVRDKLKRAAEKYPAALMVKAGSHHGSGGPGDTTYWRIKEKYRRDRALGKKKS